MAMTILVVDDEAPVRELLRRWLEGWGYCVTQTSNTRDAPESMMAEPASIILVEIRMPGHEGFWLIERVRAKWPRTAIIVATGADDLDTVSKSRRAGFIDYVLKPFGSELLRQALERARAAFDAPDTGSTLSTASLRF